MMVDVHKPLSVRHAHVPSHASVWFCTMEVAPFSKVGGLGDVAGSLPEALYRLLSPRGSDMAILTPLHGKMRGLQSRVVIKELVVPHRDTCWRFNVHLASLPDGNVPVYLFENHDGFTNFEQVYPTHLSIEDEVLRYEMFAKAVLSFACRQSAKAHLFHLNDWHTTPVATLLHTDPSCWPATPETRPKTLLTIHSLGYQGILEEAGRTRNLMAEGIQYCDALTTVSPTYAREICTPEGGAGLHGLMSANQDKLHGILNGIDRVAFNPATDTRLARTYRVATVQAGKAANKKALAERLGLGHDPDLMHRHWVGMVTRLVDQKGLDLVLAALDAGLVEQPVQLVILGTGQPDLEEALRQAAERHPQVTACIEFDPVLAQQIYAACDSFLMPSKFEPCGLGQLIALRYGAVPIVRKVGGLADTVLDVTESPEAGNGFVFDAYEAEGLVDAVRRAVDMKTDYPESWQALVERGMRQEWSWHQSAQAYCELYHHLLCPQSSIASFFHTCKSIVTRCLKG
ncbi:MAG: glycogen synthase [Cyanobacteria bacterium HKST-UBA04]|nr:glycogen synthase [Cyanobacteria bacterium HKST-UBA04]